MDHKLLDQEDVWFNFNWVIERNIELYLKHTNVILIIGLI